MREGDLMYVCRKGNKIYEFDGHSGCRDVQVKSYSISSNPVPVRWDETYHRVENENDPFTKVIR